MKDRIHQPYRNVLVRPCPVLALDASPHADCARVLVPPLQIPGLPLVLSSHTSTTHPGLLGICLSGAGPTILALATANFDAIAESVRATFAGEGVEVDWHLLTVGGGSEVWEDGKQKAMK